MFDVSHMLAVDVRGRDARAFLRRVLANDVARLTVRGEALYSCMLNDAGGVLDDLIVYYLAEDRYRLVVNAGPADRDYAWLGQQRARSAPAVALEPRRDLAILAVQGPRARDKTLDAAPALGPAAAPLDTFQAVETDGMLVARTGYTGEDGFEIMAPSGQAVALWHALAGRDVAPAGLGARDTLRLEAGLNLYGQDMDEQVTPLEAGLAWTVALGGGREFIGREALERRPATRRLLGVVLLDRGVMRSRQKVRGPSGAGEITSGGYSPTLNRSIALARLPLAAAPGEGVEVEVRGTWLRAQVVKPPFVRHGQVLIIVES
jgi:aminomethyltransferase